MATANGNTVDQLPGDDLDALLTELQELLYGVEVLGQAVAEFVPQDSGQLTSFLLREINAAQALVNRVDLVIYRQTAKAVQEP
jgi:hypothetical protein